MTGHDDLLKWAENRSHHDAWTKGALADTEDVSRHIRALADEVRRLRDDYETAADTQARYAAERDALAARVQALEAAARAVAELCGSGRFYEDYDESAEALGHLNDVLGSAPSPATTGYQSIARWVAHGERDDTLSLVYSVEEGPLAEIVCRGDVDRMHVATVLNEASAPSPATTDLIRADTTTPEFAAAVEAAGLLRDEYPEQMAARSCSCTPEAICGAHRLLARYEQMWEAFRKANQAKREYHARALDAEARIAGAAIDSPATAPERVRCGACGHWQSDHRDGSGACAEDDEAAMGGCTCESFTTDSPATTDGLFGSWQQCTDPGCQTPGPHAHRPTDPAPADSPATTGPGQFSHEDWNTDGD